MCFVLVCGLLLFHALVTMTCCHWDMSLIAVTQSLTCDWSVLQLFVESSGSDVEVSDFTKTRLYQLLDRFDNTIRVRIHLPAPNGLLL